MKVLIVGGAGYIGSHTVYECIRDGHEVVVVDNLSTGEIGHVHQDATFYQADIRDENELIHVFQNEKEIDCVIVFAAKLIVPESLEKPLEYYDNNVNGIRVLLEVMKKHHIKNIIFSSTAAVYGEPTKSEVSEEEICLPINPYGETKLAAERLIQWAAKAYGFHYCIFRYFNVAGADYTGDIGLEKEHLTHLIPLTIQTALGKKAKLSIYGSDYETIDGTCVRDYIHVSDLARAHILGAKFTLQNNCGTFNLGSNNGYSVKEVIDKVIEVTGVALPYEYSKRRDGDPAILIASNTQAKEILGWEIKHNLDDMIKSDWQFRVKMIDRKFGKVATS